MQPETNNPQPIVETEQPNMRSKEYLMPLSIIIAGLLIAVAIFAGQLYTNKGQTAATPQINNGQVGTNTIVDTSKITVTGEPFIGKADAPVTIAYWYDYQCPFCGRSEQLIMPEIIKNYVTTGKVKVVFKDYPFLGPDSTTAAITARAVWMAAPDKFYTWHEAVFAAQGEENGGWATKEKLAVITGRVLGAETAARVDQLIATNAAAYQADANKDKAEGSAVGADGTPAFVVGTQLIVGAQPYETIKAAIDTELAK